MVTLVDLLLTHFQVQQQLVVILVPLVHPLLRNHTALVQMGAQLVEFHNLDQIGGIHTSLLVPVVLNRFTLQQLLFHML
tara:strand:+ start:226 stop:462 length:237 start_codon:yes stop_codon:yes gene_type:complete